MKNYVLNQARPLLMCAVLAMVSVMGRAQETDILKDPRDGKMYKTVIIGSQKWMAENLDYITDSSWCYDNQQNTCDKYGRLYNWKAAMQGCPAGWHLPNDAEWKQLINHLGGDKAAWSKLRAVSGWKDMDPELGTNSGFSALPGGHRTYGGTFAGAGTYGYWWSSTKYGGGAWYYGGLNTDSIINRYDSNNTVNAFSVRCIENARSR